MSKILLLEDTCEFTPSPSSLRAVQESSAKGLLKYPVEVEGRMSVVGVRNENNRRYTLPVWQKQLKEDSQLRQLIKARRSVGLLEHPGDGNVSLNSPISHVLMDVRLEGTEIFGKIGFINTAEGNKMLALIEAGYNPLVSSRGYGSVVKASDGVDEVQEDYVCEGWDVVWNPSFKTAELDGSKVRFARESISEKKVEPVKQSEVTPIHESKTDQTTNNMNDQLKAIRESLTPLASANVAILTPQRIAESLVRCGELHRRAASVTDPTLSWDVQETHSEITEQENRLKEAMGEPARKVTALTEQSTKMLKTLKVIAETALKFKTSAAKYLKENEAKSAKLKETVERGHGWVKRARIAEAQIKKLDAKYQFACEAVDEIEARYKADTTELGRRVLQLEFKEKFTDADLLKQLNEATTLKDLIAIREKFTEPDGKEIPAKGSKGPGEEKGKESATKDAAKGPGKGETLADKKDDKDEEQKKEDKDGAKKESVDSKAGPGEEKGKEKPEKDAAKGPGKGETLADKKDDKDEEGKKGADDKKESAPTHLRTTELTEAAIIGGREFNISELSGSIRRLSESRK